MGETRKIVTIVFADVSGSTRLGEELDAEALRRVMERYFEEMRAVLEHHGGTVEKFIGDAVMAAFGIPAAHEDDALRAVRAAFEMQARLANLNEDLRRERGVTLAVRTGINTGEVVTGDPTAGHFYASGDAVNVAARLEQAAEPGEILLGEQTYQLARNAVSVEPLEPLEPKGKSQPVHAFRLLKVIEGAPALARRLDTPFVGRKEELARLLASFERAASQRTPVLVTVLGPAGIGKTRLAAELTTQMGERATVVRGRCLAYGEGITFWPLQEILLVLYERPAEAPDPEQATSTEETFWAYRKLFEAFAQERPLVLVLEDIHWAEPMLLDLIEHIVAWTKDAPMLVLCLARPEFLDGRPAWPGERLELEPLSAEDSQTIVGALAPTLDPVSRTRAAQTAEGNPLFLEQLLALAVEDGQKHALPHSIQTLLAARLDRLESTERSLLERAAVIGKEFWRNALVHVSPPETEVSALLQGLVRKRLVRPERSSFPGEDAFRFGHILIRDAAYEGIAKETRADLHERFADWLDASDSPYDEIIGYHLEQAYGYRAELGPIDEPLRLLGNRAGLRLEQAGRRTTARGDPASALNLFERACSLLSDSPRRLSASVELADETRLVGDLEKARLLLAETIEEAKVQGDERNEWLARLEYASLSMEIAPEEWMPQLKATAERARDVFEAVGDDLGLARAWNVLSYSLWNGGHYDEAARYYRRSLAHARRAGDERQELIALSGLLGSMYFGSTPVDELRRETEAYLKHVQGSPGWRYLGLRTLAGICGMDGAAEEARALYFEAKELAEELGLRSMAATVTVFAEEVGLLSGDAAFAERELRTGYAQLEEMGERGARSTVAALLAEALYLLGRHAESERFADLSLELSAAEDVMSQARGRGVKAKLLAARKEYEAAEPLAREAVDLLAKTDDLFQQSQVLMALAEVLEAAGRTDEAVPVLKSAIDVSERKGNVVTAREAQRRIKKLMVVRPHTSS
jgi:class 3 adenylate cyclase/tetratricopeptide (TPR) repeat protein